MQKMAVIFLLSLFLFMAAKCQGQTGGCPSGFLHIDKGCYLPGDVPLKWMEAKQFCLEKSSYLATIETCEENGALLDAITTEGGLLNKPGSYAYWTSGQDALIEGEWIWETTGEPITCAAIWQNGEPSNLGDEDCLQLTNIEATKIGGNDIDCNLINAYNLYNICYALCEVNYQPSPQLITKL